MDLDDLKLAWKALDDGLRQNNALALDAYRERKTKQARRGLRPMMWGQTAQLLFGLLFIALAVALWTAPIERWPPALVFAGVVLHAYGVAVVIASGVVLGKIRRVDYDAPVIKIYGQLARLRRAYVHAGMIAGLPWWFMWMLPVVVLACLAGEEEGLAWLGAWLGLGTATGAAGLVGTWWFYRWARQPGREALARRLDDALGGTSLRNARAAVEEIERFEDPTT